MRLQKTASVHPLVIILEPTTIQDAQVLSQDLLDDDSAKALLLATRETIQV